MHCSASVTVTVTATATNTATATATFTAGTKFGLWFRLTKRNGQRPAPTVTPQVSLSDTCPDPPPHTHTKNGTSNYLQPWCVSPLGSRGWNGTSWRLTTCPNPPNPVPSAQCGVACSKVMTWRRRTIAGGRGVSRQGHADGARTLQFEECIECWHPPLH